MMITSMAGTSNLNTMDKEFGIRFPIQSKLGEQVFDTKQAILNSIGNCPLAKSRPHITICNLKTSFSNFNRIKDVIRYLENLKCLGVRIEEFNYSPFPDRKGYLTVFLPVARFDNFSLIQNTVKMGIRHFVSSINYSFSGSPHITITKCFPHQLERVIEIVKRHSFEDTYLVSEIELLHRDRGKGWDWNNRHSLKLS